MIKAFVQQKFPESKKAILVGMVPFLDLKDNVWLSYREKTLSLIEDVEDKKTSAYQRQIDQSRVRAIAQYIIGSLISASKGGADVIFPNSIILAVPSDDEVVLDGEKSNNEKIFGEDGVVLMKVAENTMIVDGQHRYSGMKYLYEEAQKSDTVFGYDSQAVISFIEHYEFNCSILYNYDVWEQAQVFANVNFNQKKVNKSLFYDIYGVSIPLDETTVVPRQNEIYFAHSLVGFLNSNEKSVLRGYIKMLGTGSGYVSQAFLVESLINLMTPRGIWADALTMMRNQDKRYNYVALELVTFFSSVKDTFSSVWPSGDEPKPTSIICKTTGLGGLLLLLADLHRSADEKTIEQLKNDSFSFETYDMIRHYFTTRMRPLESHTDELFSLEGNFARGAGTGMQRGLYRRMNEILSEAESESNG